MIAATIPSTIRLRRELHLHEPLTETELIKELQRIAKGNDARWRSYIGMGYYNCITPQVILRNIFENPGIY